MSFRVCFKHKPSRLGIMEDASQLNRSSTGDPFQETGQQNWPARMVGATSLDSNESGMEAGDLPTESGAYGGGGGLGCV